MSDVANHEKDDWINGEKTEDIVAFLDRLYTAKRKVEKRIVLLGGESDPVSSRSSFTISYCLNMLCIPATTYVCS